MKQITLASILATFLLLPTFLSAQAFDVDSKAINIGIGVGGNHGVWRGGTSLPQISVSFEKGVWEAGGPGVISLGAFAGHKSFSYSASDWKWSYTTIGLRSAYHYNGIANEKVDLYAGLMLGYYIYNSSGYTYGNGGLGVDGFLGARYLFNSKIGIFGELGGGRYNFSIFKGGLAIKF